MNATVSIVVAAMFLVPVMLLLSPALYAATKARLALGAVVTRRATEATPTDGTATAEPPPAEPATIPVYDLG